MLSRNIGCKLVKQFGQRVSYLILSSALMLVLQPSVHASQNVALAWNPSGDAATAGYKIYIGETSHNYTQMVDVGNATSATVTVPTAGTKYYFSATAYDGTGYESDFSDEASFIASTGTTLTTVNFSSGQFSFTVTGTPGSSVVIEASTNLVAWHPVQTNTVPFTFVDASTAGKDRCFYRSVSP